MASCAKLSNLLCLAGDDYAAALMQVYERETPVITALLEEIEEHGLVYDSVDKLTGKSTDLLLLSAESSMLVPSHSLASESLMRHTLQASPFQKLRSAVRSGRQLRITFKTSRRPS